MTPLRLAFAALLLTQAGSAVVAQEWSRFRGPNGSGVSQATTIPTNWTPKDYNWKIGIAGVGYSSPVLWGDRIFLTAADSKSGDRRVFCYSAVDGKQHWIKETPASHFHVHERNSYATSTPVADEKAVYVVWGSPESILGIAYDHDGKQLWQQDLGPCKSQHGFGVSPIRHGDLLILANDQDNGGNLIALDAGTGKVKWTVPRKPKNATYSTPCVFKREGQSDQIIFTNWQHGITAVDPATGKVTWEISVFDTRTQERAIASPVVAGDLILATCGFVTGQKHLVAVRVTDAGKPVEAWRLERQVSYLPTPLVIDDRVYLCSEQGWATCLELKTGKEIWQERIGGGFSASPVAAGQFIYCISNEGVVHVLKTGDKYDRVAKIELGYSTQCTPAIANGRMFIRTDQHLISIGGKK